LSVCGLKVLAGCEQAPLHAQLVHQAGKTKAVHEHTDASHNTGLVDVNFVSRHRDVIRRRGTGFFHHGIDGLVVLGPQAVDFVVDDAGLHRTAAG
jgi:hypothetical protein